MYLQPFYYYLFSMIAIEETLNASLLHLIIKATLIYFKHTTHSQCNIYSSCYTMFYLLLIFREAALLSPCHMVPICINNCINNMIITEENIICVYYSPPHDTPYHTSLMSILSNNISIDANLLSDNYVFVSMSKGNVQLIPSLT